MGDLSGSAGGKQSRNETAMRCVPVRLFVATCVGEPLPEVIVRGQQAYKHKEWLLWVVVSWRQKLEPEDNSKREFSQVGFPVRVQKRSPASRFPTS
jgi:hypothetical protein